MLFCRANVLKLTATFSLLLLCQAFALQAQDAPAAEPVAKPPVPGTLNGPVVPTVEDKRVFGVLPNYRTAEMLSVYKPISAKYKLHIALKDSIDTPLLFTGAIYAGIYQAENSHAEFGQGTKGYFHRFATSYSDQIIGNMFTEGLFPIMFHEDPRYFRMAEGSFSKRTLYAVSRIFVTKTDSGASSVNYAELVGNGAASAIGLSYYPDSRNARDYVQNWGIQLFTDATSQVLKEFWPDIKRNWQRKHPKPSVTATGY
jgi:hypothetical protein